MDRNYLIDLALSIAQDGAEEWHIKEELSGLETEKEGIDLEEMPELHLKLEEEISECKRRYLDSVRLRRAKMDFLATKSPAYDYHKRCQLKHAGTAYVLMTEVYLADPEDTTYQLMEASEKAYYEALMAFMGVKEIPNCGRCLSDELNKKL